MKIKKVITLIVYVLAIAPSFAQKISSGDNNNFKKDTNKIAQINYPPLTTREGLGLHIFVPPSEHPRLFLRQIDIKVLKENSQHLLLKNSWSRIMQASKLNTDGYLPLAKDNNNIAVRDAIEAKALTYLFYGDKMLGTDAVKAVLHYFATLKIDERKPDVTREIGRAIVTGAIVYDWCYPLLSPQQKNKLIVRMETLATTMEIEWPQIKGSSIDSHTVEAQLSRDMLSLGIAVYDEKPEIYKRIAGRIFSEFIPPRHFYYPAAYHHQGSAYGAYRFNWEMFATFIFDRMGYPNIYGIDQAKVPYYFIYARRPRWTNDAKWR